MPPRLQAGQLQAALTQGRGVGDAHAGHVVAGVHHGELEGRRRLEVEQQRRGGPPGQRAMGPDDVAVLQLTSRGGVEQELVRREMGQVGGLAADALLREESEQAGLDIPHARRVRRELQPAGEGQCLAWEKRGWGGGLQLGAVGEVEGHGEGVLCAAGGGCVDEARLRLLWLVGLGDARAAAERPVPPAVQCPHNRADDMI